MEQYEYYSIEKKKSLGAFYTPKTLADYVAKITFSLCKLDKSRKYSVLDPATGDSALLIAFNEVVKNKHCNISFCGIDIEEDAVQRSKRFFPKKKQNANFQIMDALFPFDGKTSKEGWTQFIDENLPKGIDFIVCNPPWGADKDHYKNLNEEFICATGQFDIYDLFIELVVNILNDNGCFGLIVPDSIYCEEHTSIRQFLLENTTIKRIVRLGEGIFPDINIAVSLIFGIKKKCESNKVICSHLSNELIKNVLKNTVTINDAVDSCATKVLQKSMISHDYNFLTDVKSSDSKLLSILRQMGKVGDFAQSHRGIEISKKGIVLRCAACDKWFPKPRGINKKEVKCPHCNSILSIYSLEEMVVISDKASKGTKRIIVGEDIFRFNTRCKSYIKTGIEGVNYKNESIYTGSKILVRKTGVGITVGIDYNNCLTNQVVYILKRKESTITSITNEVILAVLNSRITTYYIIKTLGSNGWTSNAYLTQNNVLQLPFPTINDDVETIKILARITLLIKENIKVNENVFPNQIDAEIEYLISRLFGLSEIDYDIIFQAIKEVQQMIPFQRLLNITKEDIFKNGI